MKLLDPLWHRNALIEVGAVAELQIAKVLKDFVLPDHEPVDPKVVFSSSCDGR